MVISSLPVMRLTQIRRQLLVVIGLCAVILAVPATAGLDDETAQQLRIKRLKLADPESTETMLADRGLAVRSSCIS